MSSGTYPLLQIVYNQDIRQPIADGIAHYIRDFFAAAELPSVYVGPGADGGYCHAGNAVYVPYGENKSRLRILPALAVVSWRLWRFARSERVRRQGVLWVHRSDLVPPFILARWQGPIILTIHGSSNHDHINYRYALQTHVYRQLERIALSRCSRVIIITKEAEAYYRAVYPELATKFVLVPTFFDDTVFHPGGAQTRPRQETSAEQQDGPHLLFVGRLVHIKHVERAVSVVAYLRRVRPNACLTIAGDGPEKRRLEQIANANGVGEAVRFVGTLDRPQLASLYRSADVLLLPSDFEGLPLAALEALGSGTPVVASNVGGLKDLIQNGVNGYTIDDWSDRDSTIAKLDGLASGGGSIREACAFSARPYRASQVVPRILRLFNEVGAV